ncbi:MAG: hypothetical protein AB7P41_01610 [Dehalococcoidia bacterium]
MIWWLSLGIDDTTVASLALAIGWVTMPSILLVSLRVPRLKFGLAVPAGLVTLGAAWLAVLEFPSVGWSLVAGGTSMGGLVGAWLWFAWAPIPAAFASPNARPRLALLTVHVAIIVAGIAVLVLF